MTVHYTMADAGLTLAGVCVLPALLALPGYVFGWLLDLASFRRRLLWQQALLSLPLSIGIMPGLAYAAGRAFTMKGAVWLTAAVCAASSVVLLRGLIKGEARVRLGRRRLWLAAILFLLVWMALVIVSLSDLQIGGRLYQSVVMYDLSYRSIVTAEFARSDAVPGNPTFFDGGPVGLSYHYFWFLYCSLAQRLTGRWLAARYVMAASSVWLAMAIGVLIALYIRYLSRPGAGKGKRTIIAMGLLFVGGLDIIPAAITSAMSSLPLPTLEWWNAEQITMWTNQFLWIPNHVAALVACLTATLLLTTACVSAGKRWLAAVIAGACLASSIGLSVYVAFSFAVFLLLWGMGRLLDGRWREIAALAACAAASIVLALPFISELTNAGGGMGGPFAVFRLRAFGPWALLVERHFPNLPFGWQMLGDLLLLPVQYFLELGFFFIVLWWQWRRMRKTPGRLSANQAIPVLMASVSFAIGTLMSSASPYFSNDLGWRCFMMAQFVLVLWGSEFLSSPVRNKILVGTLLAVGLATTAVELSTLRLYIPYREWRAPAQPAYWQKPGWLVSIPDYGERAHDTRQAYEWLRGRLPSDARVQPRPQERNDYLHGLYSSHGAILDGLNAVRNANVTEDRFERVRAQVQPVFERDPEPDADRQCGPLNVAAWVVKDTDPAWQNPESWVWRRAPDYKNQHVAVFLCAPVTASGSSPQ